MAVFMCCWLMAQLPAGGAALLAALVTAGQLVWAALGRMAASSARDEVNALYRSYGKQVPIGGLLVRDLYRAWQTRRQFLAAAAERRRANAARRGAVRRGGQQPSIP
ncbi:hypothetical protein ABPG75_010000 [Micractinium tetrahymenae]